MKRIMAAVVNSPNAEAVMRVSVELIDRLFADLVLISIVDSDPMKTTSIAGATVELKTLHHRLISKYFPEDKLSKESENPTEANYGYHVGENRVNVESKVLQGSPVDKICEAADAFHADMIVIGSRGLGTLALESVSDKVAQRCAVPVLVVKSAIGAFPGNSQKQEGQIQSKQ